MYYTVIEHHPVLMGAAYDQWQARCSWGKWVDVFQVSEDVTLSIEDSVVADVRYKADSFAWLMNGSLRLLRSQVLRIDFSFGFLWSVSPATSVLVQDCYVTGLNRDHIYTPEVAWESGLFELNSISSFILANSTFTDLISQSLLFGSQIVYVKAAYQVTDTSFTRCVGHLLFLDCDEDHANLTFRNISFEGNFANDIIVTVNSMGTLNVQDCKFTDNQSWNGIFESKLTALTATTFSNNRIIGPHSNFLVYLASPKDQSILLENTTFEGNGALDSSFTAYWSDYYLAQGLLTDTGLSAEKATVLNSSVCFRMVGVYLQGAVEIVNTTFADQGPSCQFLLLVIYYSSTLLNSLLLSGVRVSSQARIAMWIDCEVSFCTLQIENSEFERAAVLIYAHGLSYRSTLQAENVTFQYATGTDKSSAAVYLNTVAGTFSRCNWRHNRGREAGGLSVKGSVLIRESQFRNNSCWNGAGDVSYTAGYSPNDTLSISSCVFQASASSLNAASISVYGAFQFSSVSHCVFNQSLSNSGSILKVAHSNGSLLLSNLTFSNIHAPSALLIQVLVPVAGLQPADTAIEGLQVSNCTFYRGIVTELGEPNVQVRQANFTGNQGAVLWIKAGLFSDYGSVFVGNTGPAMCFFGSGTVSSLSHSSFQYNYLSETTGVLYVQGPNVQVSLQSCEFVNNVVQEASVVQLLGKADVSLENCYFSGNRALGSMIYAQDSAFMFQQCSVRDSRDIMWLEYSTAQVLSSTFSRINTTAGAFSLLWSTLTLQNVSFNAVQGAGNCLLSGLSTSEVYMTRVHVEEITCREEAFKITKSLLFLQSVTIKNVSCEAANAVINSLQSTVTMKDVHLTQSSSQVLSAQSSNLTLSNCFFAKIHTLQQVGVLTCLDCALLSIQHITVEQVAAKFVGAIWATATEVTIQNSSFTYISADDTGAVRVSVDSFQLSDSTFSNITASGYGSAGGALWLKGGQLTITGSRFIGNRAWTGGAVQWVTGRLSEWNNTFQNNSAEVYGPNWASFAHTLHTNNSLVYMKQEKLLVVDLVDHFGRIMLTDNSSQATLSANNTSILSGRLRTVAVNGRFNFSDFSVFAEPGTNFTATITSSALTLQITLILRACELGEIKTNRVCERCLTGTYSLVLGATECTMCPDGAECINGNQLYPKPNYWRPNLHFPGVFHCPWPQSCKGHANYSSQTSVCAQLHTGHMCQTCIEGACRQGRDRCVLCPSKTALQLQAGFLSVGLPVLWGLQAFASTRSSNHLGALLRLLVDYLQLTVLVGDYDLLWPEPLQYFYSLHRYVGNALQAFLPLNCLYSNAFYVSTVAAAVAPIAIIVFFTSCWGVLWLIFKAIGYSNPTFRVLFINLMIVGLTYIHPFVVRIGLSAFLCDSFEPGEHWLRADLAVRCWDLQHLTFAFAASLPSVLLWGVGLPALTALYLIRLHYKLGGSADLVGFLQGGLKEQWYLWEVIVMSYKFLVAALYVLTATVHPTAQAMVLVVVLSLLTLSQRIYQPYLQFNRVALLSLGVVWGTAYAGLYFCVATFNFPLSLIVLGLHAWFLLSWILALCAVKLSPVLRLLRLRRGKRSSK